MKRFGKLALSGLVVLATCLLVSQKLVVLKVEATTIESKVNSDEDKKVTEIDVYLKRCLDEHLECIMDNHLPSTDLFSKDDLTKKMEVNHFTKEEIEEAIDKIENNRKEVIVKMIQGYIETDCLISKEVFISKLETNHFSKEDIEYGLGEIDVNWLEHAKNAAEEYINSAIESKEQSYPIYSREDLIQYLVEEKAFTNEEAFHGVEKAVIDWKDQAIKQAYHYLASDYFSKISLTEKLILKGFSKEEAASGIAETQTDWKEQASKKAAKYLSSSLSPTSKDLVDYLKSKGFTDEEAVYGAEKVIEDEIEEDMINEEVEEVLASKPPVVEKPVSLLSSQLIDSAEVIKKEREAVNNLASEATRRKSLTRESTVPQTVKTPRAEIEEEKKENRLFNNVFVTPVIVVAVLGNLYFFQKM